MLNEACGRKQLIVSYANVKLYMNGQCVCLGQYVTRSSTVTVSNLWTVSMFETGLMFVTGFMFKWHTHVYPSKNVPARTRTPVELYAWTSLVFV